MPCRTAELRLEGEVATLRVEPGEEPPLRPRAALARWSPAGPDDATRGEVTLHGIAWDRAGEGSRWGWPSVDGRIEVRESAADPIVCSVLPPALSLALAIRRTRVEFGARALVLGGGFPADLAGAVAAHLGCRVRIAAEPAADPPSLEGDPYDLVIETLGEPRALARALAACKDYGTVCSMGAAMGRGPLDSYRHVHRRALTLIHVPMPPRPGPGDEEIIERGVPGLARALGGIAPARDEVFELRCVPGGERGQLVRERGSGWCQASVMGS